ncbi:MAG: hypothetical protein RSP_04970 [Rhodanobacter sp.]
MAYYTFNIGHPATTAWWQENLARGVITTGWDNEAGDRGDLVLNQLEEGDWVLAYCNGPGFVGAGRVLGIGSYQLHKDVPEGSLSSHQHERKVQWGPFVRDVSHGIRASKVGTHPPRQTKEHIDPAVGEMVIALLKERAALEGNEPLPALGDWKYWHVLEAVRSLGGPVSVKEITTWLEKQYPNEDSGDARDNACLLSVNDANRRHHDHGRKDFRTDQGNPKDALYRVGRHRDVSYELYDPSVHGFWDIREVNGKWVPVQVEGPVSAVDRALREAQEQVATEPAPPIDNDHDARVWELRAVALREGQGEFRAGLLDAYERKCAITGCGVVEILEAAHIRPYRGEYTHRPDNGLLLRADIHTLFDKGLIWVDADGFVQLDERLAGSEYGPLRGRKLRLPADPAAHPHAEHLAHHRKHTARRPIRQGES